MERRARHAMFDVATSPLTDLQTSAKLVMSPRFLLPHLTVDLHMKIRTTACSLAVAGALMATASAQNDECATATALTNGVAELFDTSTATLSATIWPCAGGGGPDLWYTYTPAANTNLEFSTCGSSYDTALEVFTGTCTSLVPITCNDDVCGTQSQINIYGATGGTTYYVRVGGWSGSVGPGMITVTEMAPIFPTGSLSAWNAEVNAGTAPSFTGSGYNGPAIEDIGATNGANGVTYEFIVNGDNGGASSGLMGNLSTEGLKFEQWNDSMQYGVTEFGIVDLYFTGGMNTPGVDVHLAFVVNPTTGETECFENGVSFGTVPSAPILADMQGIGQILRPADPTNNVDVMRAGQVHGVAVYESQLSAAELAAHRNAYFSGGIGTNYCMAATNSAGLTGTMSADGSSSASANNLTLTASDLPANQFGIFVTSMTQAFVPGAGGTSNGNLCVGGSIGRYTLPNQILNSGSGGSFDLVVDLTMTPQGSSFVSIAAGDTWYFQGWYRDPVGVGSNFTDGLCITFN